MVKIGVAVGVGGFASSHNRKPQWSKSESSSGSVDLRQIVGGFNILFNLRFSFLKN
ncbi:MAG TPA: hypothetical protein VFC98_03765 [Clostridia bacterium]|nr:hypothetical protein [Clostridia bacterium]